MIPRSIASVCRGRIPSKLLADLPSRRPAPCRQSARRFAGATSDGDSSETASPKFQSIPAPTWSIADLELTQTHPPIPTEELRRLSRLALIRIDNDDNEERLNQDLANMLHMVQQVTEFSADGENDMDDPTCSAHIYDAVRGVTAAPLRKDDDENRPLQEEDAEEAKQVFGSMLRPKTIRKGGGHEYFAIVTDDGGGSGGGSGGSSS